MGFWYNPLGMSQLELGKYESQESVLASQRASFLEKICRHTANPLISQAFQRVDRLAFVPRRYVYLAYSDQVVPLGDISSISQPTLIAAMIDLLNPDGNGRVLEIGTGSGYTTSLLHYCFRYVSTIDVNPNLVFGAQSILAALVFDHNVRFYCGDGTKGIEKDAPYEGIIVTAGARAIPEALVNQLAVNGRLIIPVGKDPFNQDLTLCTKLPDGSLTIQKVGDVRFYPLISEEYGGWTKGLIEKAREFKKKLLLEDTMKRGSSEKDLQEGFAVLSSLTGISSEEPDGFLDNFIENMACTPQEWEVFENLCGNLEG